MKIMQCWDDNSRNDIHLVELFRTYGAKATFNIIIPETDGGYGRDLKYHDFMVRHLDLSEMKDVYAGFKVAGHGGRHCRSISSDEFKDEVSSVKQCIAEFFRQPECGYAYPGGGYNKQTKQILQQTGYKYARTTLNVDLRLPLEEPFELPSHCHFMADDFWLKYHHIKDMNDIFYFWGHSYELMNDEKLWKRIETILEHIANDKNVEWIDIIDLFAG